MPHDHTHLETASSGVSGQAFAALKQGLGRLRRRQQQQQESWLKGPGGPEQSALPANALLEVKLCTQALCVLPRLLSKHLSYKVCFSSVDPWC